MEESKDVKHYIIESFRQKYHRVGKKEKGELLKELCLRLHCHRKHAVRLMKKRPPGRKASGQKRGRKSKYDNPEFLAALHLVRKVMEFRNAEVMKANMPEWLPFIEKHRGSLSGDIRNKLLSISASTMKRYFRRMREQAGKGLGTTRPGSILRTEIPIRTESFWKENVPGKMAADTVAHCGGSTEGLFAYSLDVVCPVTHWSVQRATWGKGHSGVLEASKDIEAQLPFPLIGWHVDNGSEFINHAFVRYYTNQETRQGFSFTRSRANHKNDNCYVEQKNWSIVRRYFGYDRIGFAELIPMMNDLYQNEMYLYINHFCRTFKLDQKIAVKSRYRRIYGMPLTPYERALTSDFVASESKNKLLAEHQNLDPVLLKSQIEQKLRKIFVELKRLLASRKATSVA